MAELKYGDEVTTRNFKKARVLRRLGGGGQGNVYEVDYDGVRKALKWYIPGKLGDAPTAFYNNLCNNVDRGAPTPSFLWPQDVTDWMDGTFGYIMDLLPSTHKEMTAYQLAQVSFSSCAAMTDAAINIVNSFRVLHNAGYSYQDLNDGNFAINPKNGNLIIMDNDNVAPAGENLGIGGKCRYMAPEVVLGKRLPDKQSDRFSMAMILFWLLCGDHPLEGRYSTPPRMTPSLERKYYGSEPLCIFDPADSRNRPIPGVHSNAIKCWPQYPSYIQELFIRSFSKESCDPDRRARVIDRDWLEALVRLRSETVRCSCGEELFADPRRPCRCPKCGEELLKNRINTEKGRCVALVSGMKVFACQLFDCGDDQAILPAAVVVQGKNGELGIKNTGRQAWQVKLPSGKVNPLQPNAIMPARTGFTVKVPGSDMALKDSGFTIE